MTRSAKIVVVGAGPAGSVAAERLARAGAEVHLLDRAHFPRDKVCAGGLGPSALKALRRLGWRQQVMARSYPIRGMSLHTPSRRNAAFVGHVAAAVLRRLDLDAFLLDQARAAGATIHEGWRVRSLLRRGGRVVGVEGSGGAMEADLVLLAAGGSTSLVPRPPTSRTLQCVFLRLEDVEVRPGLVEMSLRSGILPGYAWLFPEGGGKANTGICLPAGKLGRDALWAELQDILDREFAHAVRNAKWTRPQYMGIRASLVPMPPCSPGLWSIGEAGGLVNAATGEGIGPAMWSGMTAAEAAARILEVGEAAARRRYLANLWPRLGPTLAAALPLWGLVSSPVVELTPKMARGPLAAWGARIATYLVG